MQNRPSPIYPILGLYTKVCFSYIEASGKHKQHIMKIAYHFNANHKSLSHFYGLDIKQKTFSKLLEHRSLNINSKVFVGDLMLYMLSCEPEKIDENSTRYKFNSDIYQSLFEAWQNPENFIWKKYPPEKIEDSFLNNIYVICFESIDLNTSEYLHEKLKSFSPYLGAMEVDETSRIHWELYGAALIPFGRFYDKKLSLFYQEGDEIENLLIDDYKTIPFKEIKTECLNWRYTIFDTFSGYEEARRIAEWKRNSGALLAFIADDIVSKLSDIAPNIGNKLWSTLKTFNESETNEQLAQVTASCRRIFEYVTDCIFPPNNDTSNGHSLKADKYKNRLYAYADQSRKSDTNIDLIVAATATLFEQWDKLNNLSNKGVHAEVFRTETRRCLLRTIMLLDDIVSLKESPFDIKPNVNFEEIFKVNAS